MDLYMNGSIDMILIWTMNGFSHEWSFRYESEFGL